MEPHDIDALLDEPAARALIDAMGARDDATLALQSLDGRILWATPMGATRMYERTLEEFVGQDAAGFIHPDDRINYERVLDHARRGETMRWTGQVMAGSGRYRSIRSVIWRIDQTSGEPAILSLAFPVDGP